MNRTVLLTGTLAVLSLVVLVFWLKRSPKDTYADDPHTQFAYEHEDNIHKIFLADWGQNQAELVRGAEGQWNYTNKITGKQFPVRPDAMYNLLETIKNVRVRFQVPEPAIDNVVKSMTGKSRKVQLYDAGGKVLRSYNVGGPAERGEGTYMLMDSAQRPCVVYLPSWVGSVHTRYIVTEDLWRDRALFRIQPQNLEWVEVEYHDPLQMQHSFRIEKGTGNPPYRILPLHAVGAKKDPNTQNNDNLQTYIDDFDQVVAEIIVNDKALRDSVVLQRPFAGIRFKVKQDTAARQITLYPIFNPGANRGDGNPGVRNKIERYYADMGPEHFYVVQHPVVVKLLWGYSYFFQEEKVVVDKD